MGLHPINPDLFDICVPSDRYAIFYWDMANQVGMFMIWDHEYV